MPSLSMGALAADPVNPSIVYAGTGNIYNNGFFKGIGLYRSTDGGETWSEVAGNAALQGIGIHDIAVPTPNVVLVATNSGLFRSVDAGASFGSNAPAFDNGMPLVGGFASDIDLDTQSPSTTVYVSVSGQGIFRSTDGGATFPTNLWAAGVTGAPTAGTYVYTSFAQSTDDGGVTMYADTEAPGTSASNFGGFYRSTDGGATWTDLTSSANAGGRLDRCQCGYDQTIGVDPQNANRVYIGFQELFRSDDGGLTFVNVTDGKVHLDHHEIAFSPPSHWTPASISARTTRVYAGQDGGLVYSDDAGATWTHINGAIATNLFRAMDIGRGPGNNGWSYGGAQDTGTMHHDPTLHPGTEWHEAINGDGGPMAVSWQDPRQAHGSSNGGYIRTETGGASWVRPGATFPACTSLTAPPQVDPNDGNNVFLAQVTRIGADAKCRGGTPSFRLWRSNDHGASFTAVGAAFSQAVTVMANVPLDSATMWFGLADGRIATSNDVLAATPTFTTRDVPGRIGSQPVADIAVDPRNTDVAVVVYRGFAGTAAGALSRHVLRTADGGATWADIGGTARDVTQMVPDLPLYSVVIDPQTSPHTIIASTDLGILRTLDNGVTWQRFGLGLPNVNATSLEIDYTVTPSLLRVGTYGRSAFELTAAPARSSPSTATWRSASSAWASRSPGPSSCSTSGPATCTSTASPGRRRAAPTSPSRPALRPR
jgi:photosystem II stability/assembly factor-like uncharacterized protein